MVQWQAYTISGCVSVHSSQAPQMQVTVTGSGTCDMALLCPLQESYMSLMRFVDTNSNEFRCADIQVRSIASGQSGKTQAISLPLDNDESGTAARSSENMLDFQDLTD